VALLLLLARLPSASSLVAVVDDGLLAPLAGGPGPHRQELRSVDGFAQYKGTIKLGGQPLEGVMDTGSAELVVISDKCGGFLCPHDTEQFHSDDSGSYRQGSQTQELKYSGGSFFVKEAYDDLEIGPFKASSAPFWEVTESFMNLMMFGEFSFIAGLGPSPPTTRRNVTVAAKKVPEHQAILSSALNINTFSICLGREREGSIGYIVWNDDKHSSSPGLFRQLATVDSSHWMVKLTNVRLGNHTIACAEGCGAIPDSGTALLSVPSKTMKVLEAEILSWHLASKCKDAGVQRLPRLHFELDGVGHSLPPSAYMGDVWDATRRTSKAAAGGASTSCELRVMEMDMKSRQGDVWILGMPFLRYYHTTFQRKPKSLHIAYADAEVRGGYPPGIGITPLPGCKDAPSDSVASSCSSSSF